MIGKKMLMWIGAGVLSAAAIPAMAVTAHHAVTRSHAKLAHGNAKATAHKGGAKIVAGHVVHAAPVRAVHRVNAKHKVSALHAVHAKHAVTAAHTAHKSIGVTSMHSGRTNASVIHKATGSAHASVAHKATGGAKTQLLSTRKVTAKAAPHAITLAAVAPKKTTHAAAHTTIRLSTMR